MIAKFVDHLPLYRQEKIFGRAGLAIPQSTLADRVGTCGVQLQALVDALREELLTHRILHADETPVSMLKPGKGKTHRAYIWSYCTTRFAPIKAVSALVAASSGSFAAGCLKGAAVGGVGGHFAGHHAVAGAAVGCAVGHHMAVKKQREADAAAVQQRAASASAPADK